MQKASLCAVKYAEDKGAEFVSEFFGTSYGHKNPGDGGSENFPYTVERLAITSECATVSAPKGGGKDAEGDPPAAAPTISHNVLLSGIGPDIGPEPTGLAAAYAIHEGLTTLGADTREAAGAAFCMLCQLVLEDVSGDELYRVLEFCQKLGLPVCLADMGLASLDAIELRRVARVACHSRENIHSMPFRITEESVAEAIMTADRLGAGFRLASGAHNLN